MVGTEGSPPWPPSLLCGANASPEGVTDKFCVASEIELAHQIRSVGLDRAYTDEKPVCNPGVTQALTDQREDFPLPRPGGRPTAGGT
jgi:hypothetical protein